MTGSRTVPPFCGHCGNAMPWVEEAFRLTEELIDVIDDIPDEIKPALKQCLPDLIGDRPAAPIAALRIGRAMKAVEPHFKEAFKQIIFALIADKLKVLLKPYGF